MVDECWLLGSPTGFAVGTNHKLVLVDGNPLSDATQSRRLVGKLIYLTITCSKLSYVVHALSWFMQAPKATHMHMAK